jgi:hypothetical protein
MCWSDRQTVILIVGPTLSGKMPDQMSGNKIIDLSQIVSWSKHDLKQLLLMRT